MTDYTDDWMNPPAPRSYTLQADRNDWLIERCRRVPVSGNVAYIKQWETWSSHGTQAERDAALARLRQQQPAWQLRAAKRGPVWARLRAEA